METITNPILDNSFVTPAWLTLELQYKVRQVFEPRYGRILSNWEIVDITNCLISYLDLTVIQKGTNNVIRK